VAESGSPEREERMKPIELVIFDLDGTLIDSEADLVTTMTLVLQANRLPIGSHEMLRSNIGWGVRDFVKLSAPGVGDGKIDELVSQFRTVYTQHMLDTTVLFPGIEALLARLETFKLAVFTNKSQAFTDEILKRLGVYDRFDMVLGREGVTNPKPDPEGVLKIASALGASLDRIMLVGDSDLDIISGRNAGVVTCGATYGGIRPVEVLKAADPDYFVATPEEIWQMIARHAQNDR
jgi:phosphoglycolate phosphatase